MGRDEGLDQGPWEKRIGGWLCGERRKTLQKAAGGCRWRAGRGAELGNVAQGLCVQTGSSGPSLTLTQAAERVLRGAGTRLNLSFQKFAHIWGHHSFT